LHREESIVLVILFTVSNQLVLFLLTRLFMYLLGLAGLSFCGADVGGFFGEPSAELFTRWYQAGAFTPFFRAHAHLDTKRREPWVFGEPYTSILRQTAMIRYSLLPYWYTAFYQSYSTGQPVMRAMFSEFPADEKTFLMDDQWMVGRGLLVKPVTDAGATSVGVYFPDSANGWYDFHSLSALPLDGSADGSLTVPAPLDTIPVFIRGGSIVPRKMRLRRSASLMFYDPLTIMIAPSLSTGTAYGTYYMDDEKTLDHQDTGMFAYREFTFAPTDADRSKSPGAMTLRSAPVAGSSWMAGGEEQNIGNMMAPNKVERIVLMGQKSSPKSVTLLQQYPSGRGKWEDGEEKTVEFFFHQESGTLTIKKPNALVTAEWLLLFEY
jgi:alpha 1,3-glucosidase